ncbi:hypothetical protein AB0C84_40090, partial [Actinomadura sp. NPDC048955]|uniref:hypothetical protein n=1 Tax=Actinomadura sp. NPDC048955 TaxID=3158228 RepID=UPI0033D8148C
VDHLDADTGPDRGVFALHHDPGAGSGVFADDVGRLVVFSELAFFQFRICAGSGGLPADPAFDHGDLVVTIRPTISGKAGRPRLMVVLRRLRRSRSASLSCAAARVA